VASALHINVLEAVAAFVQLLVNRDSIRNAVVEEHIDNASVVAVFQSLKSRSPRLHLVGLWRDHLLLQCGARSSAHWIAGSDNAVADALSRQNWPAYEEAVGTAGFAGTHTPQLLAAAALERHVDFNALWKALLALPY
jgi:hypothetical protein